MRFMIILAIFTLIGAAGFLWARINTYQIHQSYRALGTVLEVEGIRLHYVETGPKEAQTVLILHGATSNLRDPYEALKGHLDDFHVIYLDRPGLGHSERPEGAWTPAREADLIQAFLEQKDLNQVILVGHSWGGAIATRTALDHSERIKGLLLLAPALRAWVGEAAWYNKASRWPGLGFLITDIAIPLIGPSQMRAGVDEAFYPEAVPEDYIARTGLPLILTPKRFRANASDMADVNLHLERQEDRYPALNVPTRILAGPKDKVLLTPRHSGAMAEVNDRVQLSLIDGAGHNLHFHHQDRIRDALIELSE